MNLFIANLKAITEIAEHIAQDHHGRYQIDELVNAAYIGFETAIANQPSLVDTKFKEPHIVCRRARLDMKDYIRKEVKGKVRLNREKAGMQFPLMFTSSFLPFDKDSEYTEKHFVVSEECGYDDIDKKELVIYLIENSHLKDKEKSIIILCFLYDLTVADAAGALRMCRSNGDLLMKKALKKLRESVRRKKIQALIV